jgi:hypothetical protein
LIIAFDFENTELLKGLVQPQIAREKNTINLMGELTVQPSTLACLLLQESLSEYL